MDSYLCNLTTDANGLVAEIHDRMPVILAPADYSRWLGEEPDPRLAQNEESWCAGSEARGRGGLGGSEGSPVGPPLCIVQQAQRTHRRKADRTALSRDGSRVGECHIDRDRRCGAVLRLTGSIRWALAGLLSGDRLESV